MAASSRHALHHCFYLAAGVATAVPLAWWLFLRPRRGTYSADYDNFLKSSSLSPCARGQHGTPRAGAETVSQPQQLLVVRNSADYDTFLRSSGPKADSTVEGIPMAVGSPPEEGIELGPNDVRLLVMFGTEYGFSKEVAETVACRLNTGAFKPKVIDMAEYPDGYPLSQEQIVLMVCSTQGDGVPPSEARPFVDSLDSSQPLETAVHFSVLALGDRSYTHFAACGKRIDGALEKLGGSRLYKRVEVHMEDWKAIDGWIDGVKAALPSLPVKPTRELSPLDAGLKHITSPIIRRYGRSNPYRATVTTVSALCKVVDPGDKETVQIQFDLQSDVTGLTYTPGDALGVIPENSAEAVEELLCFFGATGKELIPTPTWHWNRACEDGQMRLEDALRCCYDLHFPKPALLQELLACMPSGDNSDPTCYTQRQDLTNLVETLESPSSWTVESYMEPRHVIDILQDFSTSSIPLAKALTCLRPLQPRLYSISSSPLEKYSHVEATVAVVQYTSLGHDRHGVASTYLSREIQVGDKVAVYISKNPDFRLPACPETPVIMVGPGTGVAPFRAFIQQRIHESKLNGTAMGPMMLFFGCRYRDKDYLYRDLLQQWHKEGLISLRSAFSRQQEKKVYVQQLLREEADQVWRLLALGAHFYVCGDASHMAGDVEEALVDIIDARVGTSSSGAKYLQIMKETDRYQRDVWFS